VQRRILLATDLSARCDRAFDRATLLAQEWGARLTIATALEEGLDDLVGRDSQPRWSRRDSEKAEAESQIRADLEGRDVDVDVIVRRARASELIVEVARETSYDLIATGIARSTGLARAILGATVEALLRARVGPVLVVKRRVRHAYRSALVGTDFSEESRIALQSVLTLFSQAKLTVLHAYRAGFEGLSATKETDDAAHRHALDECARFVAETLPVAAGGIGCVVEKGFPETLLNQYARDKKIDLMSVGTRGRNPALDVLFGSTCNALIVSSPCDLMLV
jgi:nucleotide-binding universal stress UspA family protein